MTPGTYNLQIQRSTDFDLALTFQLSDGDPYDLTPFDSFTLKIYEYYQSEAVEEVSLQVTGASDNKLTATLTDSFLASLPRALYQYKIHVTTGTDDDIWLTGQLALYNSSAANNGDVEVKINNTTITIALSEASADVITARDTTLAARNAAQSAAGNAQTAETNAATSATDAETAKTEAITAKDAAQTAATNATQDYDTISDELLLRTPQQRPHSPCPRSHPPTNW